MKRNGGVPVEKTIFSKPKEFLTSVTNIISSPEPKNVNVPPPRPPKAEVVDNYEDYDVSQSVTANYKKKVAAGIFQLESRY